MVQNLLNSTNMPRTIELSFRKELGDINPQICLIDVAMSYFASNLENSHNQPGFLKKSTSKHGHPGLYTDHLNFSDSRRVGYVAMLALIQSKADSFCRKIQNHPCLDQECKSQAKGDFLRKTIFVIIKSSYSNIKPSNPVVENDFSIFIDNNNLLLIDYYRTIRNEQLHNFQKKGQNDTLLKLYEKIDIGKTNHNFKMVPNRPDDIDIKDIILFSKVWQKIAKDIAKSFIDFDKYVVSYLRKTFGNLKPPRRDNAVKQFLRREFLIDEAEVFSSVSKLWAG